ncbi:hypothetical protein SNE40_012482 [Patella caerulea]|uniref:Uncharacterized protein n=1 Tax=Patella caerulea TaxID=87958 RepID=A0AAN8PQN1_PATCE
MNFIIIWWNCLSTEIWIFFIKPLVTRLHTSYRSLPMPCGILQIST